MVQTTTVFANVSKGVHASAADLRAAFGDAAGDEAAMCVEILRSGELQVSRASGHALGLSSGLNLALEAFRGDAS